jgi:hypothetical protein
VIRLESRIASLESSAAPADGPLYIIRNIVEDGFPEPVVARCEGQSVSRLPGEPLDRFKRRACDEFEAAAPGRAFYRLVLSPDSSAGRLDA